MNNDQIMRDLIGKIRRLESRIDHLERLEQSMGTYGWIGGAWQKDPLRLGYSAKVERAWNNTNLSAGGNNVDDSAVPAGEIWVITSLAVRYTGTPPDRIRMSDSGSYNLMGQESPASSAVYDRQGMWILEEGDFLRASVDGATAGDDLHAWATGYRVDIDQ